MSRTIKATAWVPGACWRRAHPSSAGDCIRGSAGPVTGSTFTVANVLVAQVEVTDNVPSVRAIAGGATTTITLTRDALTAEATVTVLPEGTTEIPNGTTLWALRPEPPPFPEMQLQMRGRVLRAVPWPTPDGMEPPALFFVEHEYHDDTPARAVATTWDGQALWRYAAHERVEHFAADNRGGLVVVSSAKYEGGNVHRQGVVRKLDGTTGAVGWEYLARPERGRLSSVAIHPDGTVYTVESEGDAPAALVALDGDTGGVRLRLPLGTTDWQYASAPVITQDGHVKVVTYQVQRSDWETGYAHARLVLSEVDSETLAVTEHEIDVSSLTALDRSPLRHADEKRLICDTQGACLVLTSEIGALYRVSENFVLSSPQYLRPDPFYAGHPPLAPQIVVGSELAYVLVQNHPYAPSSSYNWGPPTVVAVDPVTLERVLTTPLDQHDEQYLLHSIGASGAAIVTGPEFGNKQEVWSRVFAVTQPNAALMADGSNGIGDGPSPYWAANAEGQNAPKERLGISVQGREAGTEGTGSYHLSVRIVPRKQSYWRQRMQDVFTNWDPVLKKYYATIGSGTDQLGGYSCWGNLKSDVNRDRDVNGWHPDVEQLAYPPEFEDILIERLFEADRRYSDDLPYYCWPSQDSEFYNSNSYVSGLLKATQIPWPSFPFLPVHPYPGWRKPVPIQQFQ